MITLRRNLERGHANWGWLDSRHTFSFANYFDPRFMGVSALRVINDDWVKPGRGFETHPHRDMEIISYILEGSIEHKDTMGFHTTLNAGDVQVMSAGSGIRHSEVNLEDVDTTLFQIWILPNERNGKPFWGAKKFPKADRANEWSVLASGDASDEGLPIRQDAKVLGATLEAGKTLEIKTSAGRYGYLVLAAGSVKLGDTVLNARDAVAITGPETVSVTADADAELVLVDTI